MFCGFDSQPAAVVTMLLAQPDERGRESLAAGGPITFLKSADDLVGALPLAAQTESHDASGNRATETFTIADSSAEGGCNITQVGPSFRTDRLKN